MSLEEIKASDKPFLLATDISGILGCDPHFIRVTARDNPAQLGFPVIRMGSRVKIPRIPFLQFMGME